MKTSINSFACIAFIMSIVGFSYIPVLQLIPVLDINQDLTFWVLALWLIGVFVTAILALKQIKRTGENGKTLAILSIIVAIIDSWPILLLLTV